MLRRVRLPLATEGATVVGHGGSLRGTDRGTMAAGLAEERMNYPALGNRIGGERVAVFPVFERFDISPTSRLRPRPLRQVRFVVEPAMEKLARLLRLAGLDCLCGEDLDELKIIETASAEKRTTRSTSAATCSAPSGFGGIFWLARSATCSR